MTTAPNLFMPSSRPAPQPAKPTKPTKPTKPAKPQPKPEPQPLPTREITGPATVTAKDLSSAIGTTVLLRATLSNGFIYVPVLILGARMSFGRADYLVQGTALVDEKAQDALWVSGGAIAWGMRFA